MKQLKYLEHTLSTYVWNIYNIQIKTLTTYIWNRWNTLNKRLQYAFETLAAYAISRSTFSTSIWNTWNISLKHLKHFKHTFTTFIFSAISPYCLKLEARWRKEFTGVELASDAELATPVEKAATGPVEKAAAGGRRNVEGRRRAVVLLHGGYTGRWIGRAIEREARWRGKRGHQGARGGARLRRAVAVLRWGGFFFFFFSRTVRGKGEWMNGRWAVSRPSIDTVRADERLYQALPGKEISNLIDTIKVGKVTNKLD
jgi:hypothetical protein